MEEMLMNIFLLLSVPLGLFMFYHGVQGLRKRQITRNQNTYTGDSVALSWRYRCLCHVELCYTLRFIAVLTKVEPDGQG
jgi:hypothetical protein